MSDSNTNHKTHTSWCLWYHNPFDKKWDLNSYKKLYEFSSLEGYLALYNNWDEYLPEVSTGMFFLMRKYPDNYIYPLWEDKYNRNGGFWSFKVDSTNAHDIWKKLSSNLVSELLCVNDPDGKLINGISISPKKNFCIIKIWNRCTKKSDLGLLNKDIKNLDFSECMYKCHNDNIANDKVKLQKNKMVKNKFFGKNKNK